MRGRVEPHTTLFCLSCVRTFLLNKAQRLGLPLRRARPHTAPQREISHRPTNELSRRLPAIAMLITLGASWFSLGTWRLSKVDA